VLKRERESGVRSKEPVGTGLGLGERHPDSSEPRAILAGVAEIIDYYQGEFEDTRLQTGWGPLELARTQELILRRLPLPPRVILDIGGGGGVYSHWLASQGYTVHLLDLVPSHVEWARRLCPPISSAEVGDARSLPHADASIDDVLLLGPLYHFTERADRLRALTEVRRVLRPGGYVFAAAICRFASLLECLVLAWVSLRISKSLE
jgi:SAM-dependent methyltransferase